MGNTQTIPSRGIIGPAVALDGYVHILQTSMDPNKSSFKEGSNQEEPNLSLTNLKSNQTETSKKQKNQEETWKQYIFNLKVYFNLL